jgi:hypothetical protein
MRNDNRNLSKGLTQPQLLVNFGYETNVGQSAVKASTFAQASWEKCIG